MRMNKFIYIGFVVTSLAGCATVRDSDLAAWRGAPVQDLDMHSIFVTMPMYKTYAEDGTEIRNYVNGETTQQCFASAGVHHGSGKHARYNEFISCSQNKVVCNNLFYIKDARVVSYQPTGDCYTNESVRPQRSAK